MRARVFKRGGSRPRRGKVSKALTIEEVQKIGMAMHTAWMMGVPFNRFITIHWERAGIAEVDAAQATASFLKYARDYLGSKCLPFAYIWVRENDEGDGSKGHHVHILAHLPRGQSLGRLQRGWIRAITGMSYCKKVILTRPIARHSDAARTTPQLYQFNLAILRDYCLKGASYDAAMAFSLPSWRLGGRVIGQRVGMSKNLSRAIRSGSVA